MYQGETFPITIQLDFSPAIIAASNVTDAKIVITNNQKKVLQFNKAGGGDGTVTVDDSTGALLVSCLVDRTQSKLWKIGEVQIELLAKIYMVGFPNGYQRVAIFTEPVIKSNTVDL